MKTKFSKIFVICCLLQTATIFTISLWAQQFRTPYEVPVFSGVCRVTMQNGAIAGGELRGLGLGRGGIKKVVVRDTVTGIKSSFYAQDIASIEFRNTGFNKALNVIAQFESIKKIKNANFGDIRESSAIFERMAPYKSKHYVGQLLNPDFASSIKVFYAANARKTNGIGFLTGGMNRAYLIEKDGVAFKVKRGNYKRNFKKLFSDCPELMQTSPGKRTFKHIEEHIYQYDNFKKSMNTL